MKKCYNCKEIKEKVDFYNNKAKYDRLSSECKICNQNLKKEYREQNQEKVKEYDRAKYQRNKDYNKLRNKRYYQKNREKIKKQNMEYYFKHKIKNRKRRSEYQKKRTKTDIIFRLNRNLRNRLSAAIRGNYKSGSAVRDLGCSIGYFKQYLESLFKPGMNWDNYGKKGWEIDHIIPFCKVDLTDRNQLLMVCNYTNLQPLWKEDHKIKTRGDIK